MHHCHTYRETEMLIFYLNTLKYSLYTFIHCVNTEFPSHTWIIQPAILWVKGSFNNKIKRERERERRIDNRKRNREGGDSDDDKIFTCALVKIHFDLRRGGVVPPLSDEDTRRTHSAMTAAGEPLGKKTCTQSQHSASLCRRLLLSKRLFSNQNIKTTFSCSYYSFTIILLQY